MKIKNKIIFISLMLLVLLSITCVSATQEADLNNTMAADETGVNEVLASCDTQIQSNESDYSDSQMNLLSYSVSDSASSGSDVDVKVDIDANGAVVYCLTENNVVASNDDGTSVDATDNDYVLGASNDKMDVYFVAPNRTVRVDEMAAGYTYPVVLKSIDGKALPNQKVTLTFNGVRRTVTTDSTGWAYFNLKIARTNTYSISLSYAGDSNYNALTCTDFTNIIVEGIDVYFVAPDRTLYLDEISGGYVYPVVLKDVDGHNLANKKVTMVFNGKTYTATTDSTGWAYFTINVKKAGKYKVTLKFASDRYYNSLAAYSIATIKVNVIDVYFVAPNRTVDIDEISKGYIYPVVLKDVNGHNLANKQVTLIINGDKYFETTDSTGWAYFNINLDQTGKYKVTLKFAGEGRYNSLSAYSITTVIVNGVDVYFVAPNRTVYLNDIFEGYDYPVVLKNIYGHNLANEQVTLIFNGEKYTATTDSTGWAYFNIRVGQTGKYKVTLKFAGDGYYNSKSSYSITTVEVIVRKNVNFVAYDKTLKVTEIAGGYSYPVIVKDSDGKAVANRKITLTFNGKTLTGTTDSKGKVYFDITANEAGTYPITINFAGDTYYYPNLSPNYRVITVTNLDVVIVVEDRDLPLNEIYFGYNYPVLLVDSTWKALANKKVTLTFNGKTQTATTDANGICYFNIGYQKTGSATVTIKFAGDADYKAKTYSKTIKITESTNPYGTKAKKAWINADSGSNDMKLAVADLLRKLGWEVYVDGTGPGYHYPGYFSVTSDYQVYITLYNGFCAGTVREAYSSSIQNTLNRKGVQLVIMWDSRDWTNPQGMAPYRYGDFTGYDASRAWDDDFSPTDPSIKNVGDWLKQQNAKYCTYPSAEGLVAQFCAGGYFAYSGK